MTMFKAVTKRLLSSTKKAASTTTSTSSTTKSSKKNKSLTYTNTTNIAVFGASGVGKTEIVNSFATSIYGKSSSSFRPPNLLTECYERKIILRSQDGTVCKHELSILDTSGDLRCDFPSVHKQAIQNSEAFVLVFALDDENSLTELEYILQDIDAVKKSRNTPVLIIANKSDKLRPSLRQKGGQSTPASSNANKGGVTSNSIFRIRNKLAHLNRGLCFEKSALNAGDGELNECFVSLLTKLEKRKGIDRSFYGVQIMCWLV